jgi:hypothetical protein
LAPQPSKEFRRCPNGRDTKFFQPSESASKNLPEAKKIKKIGHIWYDLVRFGQIWSNLSEAASLDSVEFFFRRY